MTLRRRCPAEAIRRSRGGRPGNRAGQTLAAGAALVAVIAGCSAGSTPPVPTVSQRPSASASASPAPPPRPNCNDADHASRVRSYAPGSPLPRGDELGQTLARIRKANKIKVGVAADNLLFGYRNPLSGQLEGFDIDVVNQLALEIFGSVKGHVEYVVENFAQRIPDLQSNRVDLVADIMTINCTRWSQIAFSTEYFKAGQQVLVRMNSPYHSIEDLNRAKATVCSAQGSTGSETLKNPRYGQLRPKLVDDISDCMVLFQQGSVDGIVSDNTVVAGFHAQDPYAAVVGEPITDEPYGLGINARNVDFVQYVNGLLQKWRDNGFLRELHHKWLPDDKDTDPPAPVYGRALP